MHAQTLNMSDDTTATTTTTDDDDMISDDESDGPPPLYDTITGRLEINQTPYIRADREVGRVLLRSLPRRDTTTSREFEGLWIAPRRAVDIWAAIERRLMAMIDRDITDILARHPIVMRHPLATKRPRLMTPPLPSADDNAKRAKL